MEIHYGRNGAAGRRFQKKSGCKPEGVDLCGAHVEWTTDKSSRKNVFQVGKFESCENPNTQ
ncbi:hypothetical protein JZ751_029467 [Albula glossodonta]|uniref:Uncharacterized protein n=1 Tax=Albula glossodonta TaxID=121402 RepID=A0A8T2P9D6_9TELE|nr:hypothetical protein JZ751_029467 [Albula glossodonta]